MGLFGAGEEIGGKLRRVLAALYTTSASAVAWLSAVEAESAGVVFLCCGCDVRAGHAISHCPNPKPWSYKPIGEDSSGDPLYFAADPGTGAGEPSE